MNEIKSFMEENFQIFIDWLDKMGLSDPEGYAEECIKELEQAMEGRRDG